MLFNSRKLKKPWLSANRPSNNWALGSIFLRRRIKKYPDFASTRFWIRSVFKNFHSGERIQKVADRADKGWAVNERVRAKRCDAVDWDSAKKCRLFSTSVRACDVVCSSDTAAVTELWRIDLFSCTPSSFLCAGTLSPRGKFAIFCGRFSWSRQTSQSKGFSYYCITSMTLPLNYISFYKFANADVIPKKKTTKYCLKREGKSHPCHPWQN